MIRGVTHCMSRLSNIRTIPRVFQSYTSRTFMTTPNQLSIFSGSGRKGSQGMRSDAKNEKTKRIAMESNVRGDKGSTTSGTIDSSKSGTVTGNDLSSEGKRMKSSEWHQQLLNSRIKRKEDRIWRHDISWLTPIARKLLGTKFLFPTRRLLRKKLIPYKRKLKIERRHAYKPEITSDLCIEHDNVFTYASPVRAARFAKANKKKKRILKKEAAKNKK